MVTLPHVAAAESVAARTLGHSWTGRPDLSNDLPPDVGMLQIVMVNVFFVGTADNWVLVDAGLPFGAKKILRAARERFGDAPPKAIVLTHGHFDHVGALRTLAEHWDVPIYAHELELPYLDGRSSYPPPDPTVGGGLMARLSPAYPKGPYNFDDRLNQLPDDGSVPFLPEWRWIPTPGHSPGHVSFYRDRDRVLIAGDAFVTQKQESLIGVLTQAKVLKGPPMYFTPDWQAAWRSVERLAALKPDLALTGHGLPMRDPPLTRDLERLARSFAHDSIPQQGRYVDHPAVTNSRGVVSLPPKPVDVKMILTLSIAGIFVAGTIAYGLTEHHRRAEEAARRLEEEMRRAEAASAAARRRAEARAQVEVDDARRRARARAARVEPWQDKVQRYAKYGWRAARIARWI